MFADRGPKGATKTAPTKYTSASRTAQVPWSSTSSIQHLQAQLGRGPFSCISAGETTDAGDVGGLVLTSAPEQNNVEHLERELSDLVSAAPPRNTTCCDCIPRRFEDEQTQKTFTVSKVLSRQNVMGLSIHGGQIALLHTTQTMSGATFYRPTPDDQACP